MLRLFPPRVQNESLEIDEATRVDTLVGSYLLFVKSILIPIQESQKRQHEKIMTYYLLTESQSMKSIRGQGSCHVETTAELFGNEFAMSPCQYVHIVHTMTSEMHENHVTGVMGAPMSRSDVVMLLQRAGLLPALKSSYKHNQFHFIISTRFNLLI